MIETLLSGIFGVWTPINVFVAVIGALGIGIVAAFAHRLPIYHATEQHWYWQHTLRMLNIVSVGFWLGQLAIALQENDPLWPRIVGRFLLFEAFTVFVGVGVYLGLRFRTRKR